MIEIIKIIDADARINDAEYKYTTGDPIAVIGDSVICLWESLDHNVKGKPKSIMAPISRTVRNVTFDYVNKTIILHTK